VGHIVYDIEVNVNYYFNIFNMLQHFMRFVRS